MSPFGMGFGVVSELQQHKGVDSLKELLFYCYRYLAISFQRDGVTGSMQTADEYLEKAAAIVQQFPVGTPRRQELEARLLGNRGNLAVDRRRALDAIAYYQQSLELFTKLDDTEHIGIAHLKLGEAALLAGDFGTNCSTHLESALNIFTRIGWLEGQARVFEQLAYRSERLALIASDAREKTACLQSAISSAKLSMETFRRIHHLQGIGRIDSLIKRLGQDR